MRHGPVGEETVGIAGSTGLRAGPLAAVLLPGELVDLPRTHPATEAAVPTEATPAHDDAAPTRGQSGMSLRKARSCVLAKGGHHCTATDDLFP